MNGNDIGQLFFSIARCPNVTLCLNGDDDHPCSKIVHTQNVSEAGRFQLPEPWVGELDVAPILFVASNPSIGDDDHATVDSENVDVWDSHHLAFGGGRRRYIIDGTKTSRSDGSIIKSVRYWSAVKARAGELIRHRNLRPGRDYALTEVVHCKSKDEAGVAEAFETCKTTHLSRILSASPAVVVIAMGRYAWRALDVSPDDSIKTLDLCGRARHVVALQHPAAYAGPKTLSKKLDAGQMELLRASVLDALKES